MVSATFQVTVYLNMPGTQKSAVLWAQQKFQQKQFNLDRVQQLSLLKLHFVIWQLLTKRIETSFQWLHQSISTVSPRIFRGKSGTDSHQIQPPTKGKGGVSGSLCSGKLAKKQIQTHTVDPQHQAGCHFILVCGPFCGLKRYIGVHVCEPKMFLRSPSSQSLVPRMTFHSSATLLQYANCTWALQPI